MDIFYIKSLITRAATILSLNHKSKYNKYIQDLPLNIVQITIDITKHILYNSHRSRYQKIILISTKVNIIKGVDVL